MIGITFPSYFEQFNFFLKMKSHSREIKYGTLSFTFISFFFREILPFPVTFRFCKISVYIVPYILTR